jgi:branched-subunit amino acid aminotransferase/4-amino-4-deoxychorismate lyase
MIDRHPSGRAVLDGVEADPGAISIAWSDPAAQWGLGSFETLAVRDGEPQFLEEHLARWAHASKLLAIDLPSRAQIEAAAGLVASSVKGGYGWLKWMASRSGRWAAFGGVSDPSYEWKPVSAAILPWRRHRLDPLAGLKATAYTTWILGLEEARRRGADEGLWLNDRGHLISACTANVFVVRGRAVVTPSMGDGARDGVTRARAIVALRDAGLTVHQSKVRIVTLRGADEVFLTSSLAGVRAVLRIDGRAVRRGKPGPVTKKVAATLNATPTRHEA